MPGKMLRRLYKRPDSPKSGQSQSRPERFGDDIARKTEWSPLREGRRLQIRKLREVGKSRLEFSLTAEVAGFCLFFLTSGLVSFILLLTQRRLTAGFFMLLLASAALFFTGGILFFYLAKPIVFDKIRGFFWKGRTKPDEVNARQQPGSCARLHEIHALQLLPRGAADWRMDVVCELNLVMSDGRRVHLTDRRNIEAARKDGETLSRFLEKPLWDATL
jgi:hypothetical protein